MKHAVLSLSGGMDSTCLLIRLLKEGYSVSALSFDYGQKHHVELDRAAQNILYLQEKGYPISHNILDLSCLKYILGSSLLDEGVDVPEGHYNDETMKSTVVPNRNAIFSSIVFGHALSIASKYNTEVVICLGIHSGDHAIYPDCRKEFRDAIGHAFRIGNWGGDLVSYYTPYLENDKTAILKGCLDDCVVLNLDFDTILKNTNTSYNPDTQGRSSGKSGADVERIEAFLNIGRRDPVEYQDTWENVSKNIKKV